MRYLNEKKAYVLNFGEEFILKKICGKKIIDYFFDFLSESEIDVVSFPKSSENFLKEYLNDSKTKILFNESDILKADFLEDAKIYDCIMFMDYAYPNLNYIFSLKKYSIGTSSE